MKASLTWMKDYVPVDTNETGSGTGRCIDAGWNSGRRRYLDGSRVEKDFYR